MNVRQFAEGMRYLTFQLGGCPLLFLFEGSDGVARVTVGNLPPTPDARFQVAYQAAYKTGFDQAVGSLEQVFLAHEGFMVRGESDVPPEKREDRVDVVGAWGKKPGERTQAIIYKIDRDEHGGVLDLSELDAVGFGEEDEDVDVPALEALILGYEAGRIAAVARQN